MGLRVLRVLRGRPVPGAHPAREAQGVLRDPRVHLVLSDLRETQALPVPKVLRVLLGPKGPRVLRVIREFKEPLVPLDLDLPAEATTQAPA